MSIEQLLDFIESSPVQKTYLESLAKHSLEDSLALTLPMQFLFTHVTGDEWKNALEEKVKQAGGPFSEADLSSSQTALRYGLAAGDLPAFFKKENSKSKAVRRIVLDAKKAMRTKGAATEYISDLVSRVQTNLSVFFGWNRKDVLEKTDCMLKSCRRDLSAFLDLMAEPDKEALRKSAAFQRLAVQLLEGAVLVPDDEKQFSDALIQLAKTADRAFCGELDERMSKLLDETLKRFGGPLTGQNEDRSFLNQDDADSAFVRQNTASLALKHSDPKSMRKLDALMGLIEEDNNDSQDPYHYFAALAVSALTDPSLLKSEKSLFVLFRQDIDIIEAALKAVRFYQKIVPCFATALLFSQMLGLFTSEHDENFEKARKNVLHNLETKDVLNQIAGIFGLAVMSSSPIAPDDAPKMQFYHMASLALHLLYEDKALRIVNRDFVKHVEDLYEQILELHHKDPDRYQIKSCKGDKQSALTCLTSFEYRFFMQLGTVLGSVSTPALKGKLAGYLVSDFLHSPKPDRQLLLQGADPGDACTREPFYAAFFLRLVLNGKFIEAMMSPFVLYLRAASIHDWGPMLRTEADSEYADEDPRVEYLFDLMQVRLDEKEEYRNLYNEFCRMLNASVPAAPDFPFQPDITKDMMLIDDGVFSLLSLIEEKPEVKKEFDSLSCSMQAWILTLVSRLSGFAQRLREDNYARGTDRMADQLLPDTNASAGDMQNELDRLQNEAARLRDENRILRQQAAQSRTDAYIRGRKEAEDRLLAQNRNLKKQLEQALEKNQQDQQEKEELYQLRELIFTDENESASGAPAASDADRKRIDRFLKERNVVFIGGHPKYCSLLRERYKSIRIYPDESFPPSVVSSADLCILFTRWLCHGAYYKVRAASRTEGRTVPLRYIGSRNLEFTELELLKIIDEFEKNNS